MYKNAIIINTGSKNTINKQTKDDLYINKTIN